MTDFRALCAELANHLQARVTKEDREVPMEGYHSQGQQLIDRARAALAEPQPAAATGKPGLQDGPAVQSREPASVITEPSDEELLELMSQQMRDDLAFMARKTAEHGAPAGLYRVTMNTHLAEYARAVLARWGTPNLAETRSSLEPIPVSERLPEAGDCDADGRCWWLHKGEDGVGDWFQRAPYPSVTTYAFFRMTHWLPFNALPLPEEVE